MTKTKKATAKDLQYMLGCCYATAKKEYKIILACINPPFRNYLTFADIEKYGL